VDNASVATVFAVIAGLLFAIPWASVVAGILAGDPAARPVLWHELHAIAGVGFALSLLELRARYRGWFTTVGRLLLSLAIASGLAFAAANAGELVRLGALFAPLYGVALVGLSIGLVGTALATRTLPRPLPLLLVLTGAFFPASLILAVVTPPLGLIAGYMALMGYGLLWTGFGFVQLSRNP
jgi:hypothetical protein